MPNAEGANSKRQGCGSQRVEENAFHLHAGTTAAGLRAGKPTLVVPHMSDQPYWGRRVFEIGAGPRPIPRHELTADALAASLDTLARDDGIREVSRVLGEKIRAEQGVEAAVAAINGVPDAIMPFPGGIARSGSKVGSKYRAPASTNDAYCPTLRGAVKTALDPDIASVLEIVIDGLTSEAVANAMAAGLAAILRLGPKRGALRVGAGNYGGKLGPHHYHLKDLLP